MSDFFPWDDIYEGTVFPAGIFLMEIMALEDGYSNNDKRMPKGRFRCVEPVQLQGKTYFDQYPSGTDENPADFVAGSFGSQSLKAIFKAAQVPKGTSFEELMKNSVGNRLLIHLSPPFEDDYGLKNRVVAYYKVGEREVGLQEAKGGATVAPAKSSAKLPPPAKEAKAPEKKKKAATLPCGVCGKHIPRDEYATHVDACQG